MPKQPAYGLGDKIDGFEVDGVGRADHRGSPAYRYDLVDGQGGSVGRLVLLQGVVAKKPTVDAVLQDIVDSASSDAEAVTLAKYARAWLEGFIGDAPKNVDEPPVKKIKAKNLTTVGEVNLGDKWFVPGGVVVEPWSDGKVYVYAEGDTEGENEPAFLLDKDSYVPVRKTSG